MPELAPLLIPAIAIAALMLIAAVIGAVLRDNSIVDVFWGLAFLTGSAAAVAVTSSDARGARTWLVLALTAIWAFRLAVHIGLRKRRQKEEDWRYQNMRTEWGSWTLVRSFFKVYFFQGLLAFIGCTAMFVVAGSDQQQLDTFAWIGAAVWVIGFATEVIGDLQITRFIARKQRGEVEGFCTEGLWSITRHPNYLGEAIAWLGISLIAAGVDGGWLGFVSAALVYTLVRWVSGVPILERSWRERPGFDAWAARAAVFLPTPRKLAARARDSASS